MSVERAAALIEQCGVGVRYFLNVTVGVRVWRSAMLQRVWPLRDVCIGGSHMGGGRWVEKWV